jgi:hypothetical protein
MDRRERSRSNGKRGSRREAVAKASEANALEGPTPRRARIRGSRAKARRASGPLPGRRKPLKSRPRGFPLRRNDRRGEAPRGVRLAGRSKALKGEPQGRCGGDGRREAWGGGSRREGAQTLRAEGAGTRKPREYRISHATGVVGEETPGESFPAFGPGRAPRETAPRTSQAHDGARTRESAFSARPGRPQGEKPRRGSVEPNKRYRSSESLKRG